MLEGRREWLLRALRVPAEPQAPDGTMIRVFRAAPPFYRYKLVLWGLAQVGAIIGLVSGLVGISHLLAVVDHPLAVFLLRAGEAFAWIAFLVQLPFSLALLRLDFDMRWYMLSDRSLRIREGIVTVREKTMTFANIQQISIRENPLQRMLGIADVQVRTAGGGGAGGSGGKGEAGEAMHEAFFRGVDNAEEIRGAIQQRVRVHRDAGLGDPDEPEPRFETQRQPGALAAARELLDEVRRLRGALMPPPSA